MPRPERPKEKQLLIGLLHRSGRIVTRSSVDGTESHEEIWPASARDGSQRWRWVRGKLYWWESVEDDAVEYVTKWLNRHGYPVQKSVRLLDQPMSDEQTRRAYAAGHTLPSWKRKIGDSAPNKATLFEGMTYISGEYWITSSSGDTEYADGDVGDKNHEAIAIEHAQHMVADLLDAGDVECNWSDWMQWMYEEETGQKINLYKQTPEDELAKIIAGKWREWPQPKAEALLNAACGYGDVRAYAEREWGWKRVHGDNIESWTLNPADLQAIARGINDILGSEGRVDDDTPDDEMMFYLSSYKGGRSMHVSLADMRAGQATGAQKDTPLGRNAQVAAADAAMAPSYYGGKLGDSMLPRRFLQLLEASPEQLGKEKRTDALNHEAQALARKWDAEGLQIALNPYHGGRYEETIFELYSLRARRDAKPGTGTAFMEALCDWADEHGVMLLLGPAEKDWGKGDSVWKRTTSHARLKRFYRRFGFVVSTKKGRYDLGGGKMHRHPR